MLANWVKESTATAGTGTINLGGAAAGHIPFSAAFATGDRVLYSITDGNDREIGIGTLTSGSPWTLARTQVLQTLVAGTYDDTAPAAIALSGAATVGIDMASQSIEPDLLGAPIMSGGFHLPPNATQYNNNGKGGGEFGASAGRIVLAPLVLPTPTKITAIGAQISTASAGGNFRVGIYAGKRNGDAGALLADSGNLSTTSTGAVFSTLGTPLWLPAGNYYAADAVDNTTATAYGGRGSGVVAFLGSRWGTDSCASLPRRQYYDQAYGAFPSTWPGASGSTNWATFGLIFK